MPFRPEDLKTGGAASAVAASLLGRGAPAAVLEPGQQVGAWRVLSELGRGGMAVVYLAERADGEYRQQVALKWMQAVDASAGAEALFRRERQALADLRHPHIARLLDGGRTAEGRPWFAMEYVEGAPLDRHALELGLDLGARIRLVLQVCEALDHAHSHGVLHRDVKPSNVLVDSDGRARLLDFGIAAVAGQDEGLARHAFTPGFASPEQLRGDPASVRSDVFQLGRLLAATLAADPAEQATVIEQGGQALTLRLEGRGDRPPHAAAIGIPRRLPADLRAILMRALAVDPGRRYASVEGLADDLRAFLARRPVSARPRTVGYLGLRWLQRHPLAGALSLVGLLLLTGMALGFSLQLRAERDLAQAERDIAQRERDAAERAHARAEAVLEFFNQDVLDAANPLRRSPGAPEVTVRQALDAAEARVVERLADRPQVLLAVLGTLANLRYEFGDYAEAATLFERALALPVAASDPQRLQAQSHYGALLISEQRFDEAAAIFDPLRADCVAVHGAGSLCELEAELRLLEARSRQGADVAQQPAFEALAQRSKEALGQPNRIAGEARLFIAHGFRMAGTAAEGTDSATRAHADLAATLGADHPSTLKALAARALGLQAQGRDDEAVQAMRSAYTLHVQRYGPDGLDAMFLQNELGFMLVGLGRAADAVPVLADLARRRAAYAGERSIGVVAPLSNLANAHLQLGELEPALRAIEGSIRAFESLEPPPPALGSVIYRVRADVLREMRRYEASARSLDLGDAQAATLPAQDVRRLALQASRARLRVARGERAEGLRDFDSAIAALRERLDDAHPLLRPLLRARAALGD